MRHILLALALGIGCSKQVKPAPVQPVDDVDVAAQMHKTYSTATSIRVALAEGSLAVARVNAEAIANAPLHVELPPEVKPIHQEVRAAAARIPQAMDVPTASAALADMARSCGRCHEAVDDGPAAGLEFMPRKQAPASKTEHAWAADWLWLGLVGGNAVVFGEAATVLSKSEMGTTEDSVDAANSASTIHASAAKAASATSPEERAELYANMLSTCWDCHLGEKVKRR